MIKQFKTMCATFFYIGFLPTAPGSLATLAGIGLAYALAGSPVLYLAVTVLVTVIGFAVGGDVEKAIGKKDPGCIVIDEVAGILIAFYGLPHTWAVFWTGFFLFRAFDMFKIYPGNKLEGLPGSAGIMLDDLVAGVYTAIVMNIALRLV
jgi:phosphatidylglycerophosphatase A